MSYSTAILQDRAWRLWAAEQLVLMTFPEGRIGVKTPVLGHHAPPRRGRFTPGMMGGRNPTGFMLGGVCAMLFWAKSKLWLLGARETKWGCIPVSQGSHPTCNATRHHPACAPSTLGARRMDGRGRREWGWLLHPGCDSQSPCSVPTAFSHSGHLLFACPAQRESLPGLKGSHLHGENRLS